jgi:ubiquinone/menaquinone biosynthesis C-methylase UbiE
MTEFENVYANARRAEAYARLEFPGTYYLAYRDLPEIIAGHVRGNKALDFGCGTGRSTRYLKSLGFDVVGIDISEEMLEHAVSLDENGRYFLVNDGDLSRFENGSFDLVFSIFTFDNMAAGDARIRNLREIMRLLEPNGVLVNLVSSPEIYLHEWASFSTKDFPENRKAKTGDIVRIIVTDVEDSRPVEDILCTDDSYRNLYKRAGMRILDTYRPLALKSEPYEWVNETRIAPWVIYVLTPQALETDDR